MLALSARFTCKDEASAAAHDELVAATVAAIRASEPGTLIYTVHRVDGEPLQRIFYELYTDQAAFEAHEAAPHTRRYLAAREQYLARTEVDRLTLLTGKGVSPGAGEAAGQDGSPETGAGASGSAGAASVTISCTSTANGHSAASGPGSPGGPGGGAAG